MEIMAREAKINRKTTETEVSIEINLDGAGSGDRADDLSAYVADEARLYRRDHVLAILTDGHRADGAALRDRRRRDAEDVVAGRGRDADGRSLAQPDARRR